MSKNPTLLKANRRSTLASSAAASTAIKIQSKIEMRPIDSVKPNPRNARTHSKKQTKQIAGSIKQFGFINPIVIHESGMVLAGHGRLEAARLLGLKEVPVVEISHLSEVEKRAYVLADNKLAENAGWDRQLLADELGDLAVILPELSIDLDVSITGFSPGEIDSILQDHAADVRDPADEIEFPDRPTVTKRGDLWQMGPRQKHRVLCGDARSESDLAKLMAGVVAYVVMTDPPYNVRISGHVGGRGKTKHNEFACASGEMSREEFGAFLARTIGNMIAVLRLGGLVYIFMDWRHVEDLLQVCRAHGLELRNICIWNKTTPGQGSFYRSAHEMIVVCEVPGGEATNNIELGRFGRNRTNVWTYPGVNTFRVGANDELALHPTVKPVAMIAEALKDASARGGAVLDPFLGSGTTLLACEKTGRRCYGLEFEPRYVDVAIQRWQRFTGQDAILVAEAGPVPDSLVGLTFEEVQLRRNSASPHEVEKGHSDSPIPMDE